MKKFAQLGLNATLQENLKNINYIEPTDIQNKSIGAVLSRADTYAIAPTGTGKTAAYLLPVLQELSQSSFEKEDVRPLRALILVPTRELAEQVEESVISYGKGLGLRTITVFGGVRISSQTKRFKRGTDILIATPKRLIDLLKLETFSLADIQHFVMDEADRLVSMGIQPILSKILKNMPAKKQLLIFSATDSKALQKFGKEQQNNARLIHATENQPVVEQIFHTFYRCARKDKTTYLLKLIEELSCDRAIIFVRTKQDVNLLVERLKQNGLSCAGIHNEIPNKKRHEIMASFKQKEFCFLVATDILSRGIDLTDLYYVINIDLPVNSNDYIHRVGRTARKNLTQQEQQSRSNTADTKATLKGKDAAKTIGRGNKDISLTRKIKGKEVLGHAFSFVSPEQERLIAKIAKAVGKELKLEKNPFSRR
jgi:ATP-dependent RNA helicase RhlE